MQMNWFNVSGVLTKASFVFTLISQQFVHLLGCIWASRRGGGKHFPKPKYAKGKPLDRLTNQLRLPATATATGTGWKIKSDTFIGHFGMRRGLSSPWSLAEHNQSRGHLHMPPNMPGHSQSKIHVVDAPNLHMHLPDAGPNGQQTWLTSPEMHCRFLLIFYFM